MKSVRLGTASLNQTPMDWAGNKARIEEAISIARDKKIQLLSLPELCITGYGCEDMFHAVHLQEQALEILFALDSGPMAVMVGLPIRYRNSLYNCVAVSQHGEVKGIVAKQSRATDGVHYEPRWFKSWPRGVAHKIRLMGRDIPFGDLVFETEAGVRFGFEICEDAWVAERAGAALARRAVDVIFNPSASHFAFEKHAIRRQFVTEGSRAFGCAYVYSNLVGNESGRIVFDGGAIIAANGRILEEGPRFSFHPVSVTAADVDVDVLRVQRTIREGFESALPEEEGQVVRIAGGVNEVPFVRSRGVPPAEPGRWERAEEFEQAVALGLFDYLRKSGAQGYVVSLSGGADSTATALLVAAMVKKARAELNPEELPRLWGGRAFSTENVLTTAYQATANSSAVTREAAATVAAAIGARHLVLDVDAVVEAYKNMVGQALDLQWDWEKHDISLQNIQARARAPSIWMVANVEGKILLATSNRSEASVGYATMDGDTAGGLSPIAGIDKAFLLQWLKYKEEEIEAVKLVTAQRPTAELRPSAQDQTDEEDLMPYDVLNSIEALAIGDKKSPADVLTCLGLEYPERDAKALREWVARFFELWSRNQWKRERYAPGFHLDDKSVDPKSWCRFPILSGGYRQEIARLRDEQGGNR